MVHWSTDRENSVCRGGGGKGGCTGQDSIGPYHNVLVSAACDSVQSSCYARYLIFLCPYRTPSHLPEKNVIFRVVVACRQPAPIYGPGKRRNLSLQTG